MHDLRRLVHDPTRSSVIVRSFARQVATPIAACNQFFSVSHQTFRIGCMYFKLKEIARPKHRTIQCDYCLKLLHVVVPICTPMETVCNNSRLYMLYKQRFRINQLFSPCKASVKLFRQCLSCEGPKLRNILPILRNVALLILLNPSCKNCFQTRFVETAYVLTIILCFKLGAG